MQTANDSEPSSILRRRAGLADQTMVPRANTATTGNSYSSTHYRRLTSEPEENDASASSELLKVAHKAKDSSIHLEDIGRGNNSPSISNPHSRSGSSSASDDVIQIQYSESISEVNSDDDVNESDLIELLPRDNQRTNTPADKERSSTTDEASGTIALQISFPFLVAGVGMVAAGLVLDKVQHWEVFQKVSEVFILVPALLGLKGNLEMTLASRLSTVAHLGHLDDPKKKWSIIGGNMVLVEAQAMVVAFLASLVAMVLGWIPDGKWETNHALILCAGSLATGVIASGVLGAVMITVILLSRKCGINPDNVATPIAASLGDLTTLSLLSAISDGLYNILLDRSAAWIVWAIIVFFVILTPIAIYLSYRNEYTRDVIQNGWFPILAAMGISSVGGFILDFAVSANPGVAVFAPVINGVGGNFVAVQASRISTYLHKSNFPLGSLPKAHCCDCVTPCVLYGGKDNPHAKSARVMTVMAIPGQLLFLLMIAYLNAGHTSITPQFVLVYVIVSLIQVTVLLYVCHCLVHRLWRTGQDPDNCAIPYLTALGDLLGTGLLGLGFLFLWTIGDRDQDVGD